MTDGPKPTTADRSESDPADGEAPPVPLLQLRDGLPDLVCDTDALKAAARAVSGGSGPVAVDAERASGYRYSPRAYLVQLRRHGAGTALVDPTCFDDLAPLAEALAGTEWIIHAASQDLPCLAEIGLRPSALFDTELAGRLLGYPRVGLATLVEDRLGRRMRKEHSAVDWSTRPLPAPWLEYAALDVEPLVELQEVLRGELEDAGKWPWAEQEFAHLKDAGPPEPRAEPWRRTSGLHRVRGRRALAAVRELWQARDEIAARRDVTPGRIIPDSAIVAAAAALPAGRDALLAVPGFHGRGARRYAATWVAAVRAAQDLPDDALPPPGARFEGPPPPRTWAERNPAAATRLARARTALLALADKVTVPVENLITPDIARRVLWEPPEPAEVSDVARALAQLGARPWQVELTAPILAAAIAPARG